MYIRPWIRCIGLQKLLRLWTSRNVNSIHRTYPTKRQEHPQPACVLPDDSFEHEKQTRSMYSIFLAMFPFPWEDSFCSPPSLFQQCCILGRPSSWHVHRLTGTLLHKRLATTPRWLRGPDMARSWGSWATTILARGRRRLLQSRELAKALPKLAVEPTPRPPKSRSRLRAPDPS